MIGRKFMAKSAARQDGAANNATPAINAQATVPMTTASTNGKDLRNRRRIDCSPNTLSC
jgi:hypothetical protein